MKFAGKWKELENIILSEVTQTQKDKYEAGEHISVSYKRLQVQHFLYVAFRNFICLPPFPFAQMCDVDAIICLFVDVLLHLKVKVGAMYVGSCGKELEDILFFLLPDIKGSNHCVVYSRVLSTAIETSAKQNITHFHPAEGVVVHDYSWRNAVLFAYMVYYIDRFSYVEPSLHSRDEAYLVMVDNFLMCSWSQFANILLSVFAPMFMSEMDL
ncbi:hypothetical protein STEG23_026223 [Scotinomys teguina]